MPIVLETPTLARLPDAWRSGPTRGRLEKELAYRNLSVAHQRKTWAAVAQADDKSPGRHWFVRKYGRPALDAKVAELQAQEHRTALFDTPQGLYTYSGLAPRLAAEYGETVERGFPLPEREYVSRQGKPLVPRPYQTKAVELLLEKGHAAVELATGLGKSHIICELLFNLGLPAVVVAPTLSIARQLLLETRRLFGKKTVGQFFAGKKEASCRFVIAVSKSLLSVAPGTALAALLQSRQVLICDESHLLPAETLSKLVLKMFKKAPYRFFLSGTQMRNDGQDLVLEGLTGEVVIRMNVQEGIDQGYLNDVRFTQFQIGSSLPMEIPDPIKMNRVHLHRNEQVYIHAAALVQNALEKGYRPLVLIEETAQAAFIHKHFKVPWGLAHGGVDAKMKKVIPKEHHKSDPHKLVDAFDAGTLPVLVGTQCIGVGTDIKTADFIVDIVGLASEVRVRQNVGRGTRKVPGKRPTQYCDYQIYNIGSLNRHAEKRRKVFQDIVRTPVRVVTT